MWPPATGPGGSRRGGPDPALSAELAGRAPQQAGQNALDGWGPRADADHEARRPALKEAGLHIHNRARGVSRRVFETEHRNVANPAGSALLEQGTRHGAEPHSS